MRRSIFFFLLFLFLFVYTNAQQFGIDDVVSVQGFVSNPDNKNIESVHIVNISQRWGTTSNWEGQFRIAAMPGDTMRFTCVGYIPYKYYVPAYRQSPLIPVHIVMLVDTTQISGVTIYPWPYDAKALKEAVLAMEDQTPNIPDLKLNDPKFYNTPIPGGQPKTSIPGMVDPGLTFTVPGPITAMYDAFSKEGKSRRLFESLTNQDQRKVVAARRYNAGVVKRVTHFETDKEIQDFMIYCNLSVDFIVRSSEYDLYTAIHDCLLAYTESKKTTDKLQNRTM